MLIKQKKQKNNENQKTTGDKTLLIKRSQDKEWQVGIFFEQNKLWEDIGSGDEYKHSLL